ncbi:MAG: hypothetical protein S4CHLAM81_07420 [Chlamydiales bacterium]|nr:hypothetical protein [Chlamydiales bacterium]MCH9635525.1 hypothetical protein [Chlamydiales bacterium]MCH9703734.1 hypothetical protein [Chlamydiota bacterium]
MALAGFLPTRKDVFAAVFGDHIARAACGERHTVYISGIVRNSAMQRLSGCHVTVIIAKGQFESLQFEATTNAWGKYKFEIQTYASLSDHRAVSVALNIILPNNESYEVDGGSYSGFTNHMYISHEADATLDTAYIEPAPEESLEECVNDWFGDLAPSVKYAKDLRLEELKAKPFSEVGFDVWVCHNDTGRPAFFWYGAGYHGWNRYIFHPFGDENGQCLTAYDGAQVDRHFSERLQWQEIKHGDYQTDNTDAVWVGLEQRLQKMSVQPS